MVLSTDGTTEPGLLVAPKNVKAHVYLPPHLLSELPSLQEDVSLIIQCFIEAVGVPNVRRWYRAAGQAGWQLPQKATWSRPYVQLGVARVLEPSSPGFAHYIITGRACNSFTSTTIEPPPSTTSDPPSQQLPSPSSDGEAAERESEFRRLRKLVKASESRIAILEAENLELRGKLQPESATTSMPSTRGAGYTAVGFPRPNPYHLTPSVLAQSANTPKPPTLSLALPVTDARPIRPLDTASTTTHNNARSDRESDSRDRSKQVIQVFGSSSAQFIDRHDLGDKCHYHLAYLLENMLPHKWTGELENIFPDRSVEVIKGLHSAMCDDISYRPQNTGTITNPN